MSMFDKPILVFQTDFTCFAVHHNIKIGHFAYEIEIIGLTADEISHRVENESL